MKTKRFAKDVLSLLAGIEVEWSPNGGVWLSLHSDDPTEDGDQSSSEVYYSGYQRVFIGSDVWEVGSEMKIPDEIRWPKSAWDMKGEQIAKFIGIGMKGTGDGYLATYSEFEAPISIKSNTSPAIEGGKLRLSES